MKKWVKTTFFVVDENIQTSELINTDNFLFIKKGVKDPNIISAIEIMANPIVFFTKNSKHFNKKINEKKNKVVSIRKNLTSDMINRYLPKFKIFFESKTTLKKIPQLAITGSSTTMTIINAEDGTKLFTTEV
jgi:hypothetical protein